MNPDLERLRTLLQQPSWTREDLDWLRSYFQVKGSAGLHDLLKQSFEEDLIQAKKIDPAISARIRERLFAATMQSEDVSPPIIQHKRPLFTPRLAMAAAALLFVAVTGALLLFHGRDKEGKSSHPTPQMAAAKSPILPGGDKAILQLANGSVIPLDSAHDGRLATEGNLSITKHGGQLSYKAAKAETSIPAMTYNLLTTPKGGQYQLILQDGTHVWLNAASSLRYPTTFSGNERVVEMTGEAYFEVAPQKDKPFRIRIANRMQAEVLGTTFNVMAYEEEPSITTTLVDGSVRLLVDSAKTLLKPGQEGRFDRAQGASAASIRVSPANLESALAWKNGLFEFENSSIQTIMRQVARWYDVDVSYRIPEQNQLYSGSMPRKADIDSLLKLFQYTGTVHFEIEGRKVLVTK